MASEPGTTQRVWDLPVRLMHWGLALSVLGAWLTRELEGDWFAWHVRFGYAVLLIVTTRIVWGFVGTRYARFKDFVRGPRAILALLGLLLTQSVLGLFANDQVLEAGPLYGYVEGATSDRLTTLHKQLFDLIVVAIAIHVGAALYYLWVRRENLIRPMITGRKPGSSLPAGAEGVSRSRTLLAIAILAVTGALLWWVVATAPEASLFAF